MTTLQSTRRLIKLGLLMACTVTVWPVVPAAAQQVAAVNNFNCRGSLPEWSLRINAERSVYSRLAATGPQNTELDGFFGSAGRGGTRSYVWRGVGGASGHPLVAVINEQACYEPPNNPESSDFHAVVSLPDGEILTGCCQADFTVAATANAAVNPVVWPDADLAARAPGDWSSNLLDLLPIIRTCLRRTPGYAPFVLKAWPLNRGFVGVRTQNSEGNRFECVATANGANQMFRDLSPTAAPLPGEAAPAFTPAPQHPPTDACYWHERVLDEDGQPIGWLSNMRCG